MSFNGATMRKLLTLLVLALLLCRPAHAEMTVRQYLQEPQTGTKHEVNVLWLSGIELGMSWASTWYETHGYPRLYCPPEHLALTDDQTISILDDYLKSGAEGLSPDATIGLALLFALKHTFPCPPK
jgi:hypothetical protein